MLRWLFLLICICCSALSYSQTEIYQTKEGDIRTYGDQMQYALPIGALIGSLAIGDYEGAIQLTKVMVSNTVVITGLKYSIDRTRPDHSVNNSFPSGHTSAAFAGAGYVSHRYGPKWSLPMYTLASLVGISRVWANRHYLDDVMAGASIGVFNSIIYTTPYQESNRWSILPMFDSNSFGVYLNYAMDGVRSYSEQSNDDFDFQYELIIGATETQYNKFTAPSGSSNGSIDLADFDNEQQPANYAVAKLSIFVSPTNAIEMQFVPFETRDETKLTADFDFNGETYLDKSTLVSAYRAYTLFAHWHYNFFHKSSWILQPGFGLIWQIQSIRFDDEDGGQLSKASGMYVWPELFLRLGYKFTDSFAFTITGAGHKAGELENMRTLYQLKYDITKRWMASLLYGQSKSVGKMMIGDAPKEEYTTKSSFKYAGFSVGYSFN